MPESRLADSVLKTAWEMCDRSYRDFSMFERETDTQFLTTDRGIAFRGTTNFFDWATNLKIQEVVVPFEKTSPKIKVHRGFIEAYHCVRPFVLESADRIEVPIITLNSKKAHTVPVLRSVSR